MDSLVAFLLVISLAVVYFAPTIVAVQRNHKVAQVLVINILLGWTFLGWAIALVLAVGERQQPTIIQNNVTGWAAPPVYPPVNPPSNPTFYPPDR